MAASGFLLVAVSLQLATLCLCMASRLTGSEATVAALEPTRKVIEHVYLWKAKVDLDAAAEEEFLYSMWNLQHTVTNVEFLHFTVGRVINETPQDVRYVMRGRFPSVDDLNKYMGNQVVWDWAGQRLSPVAGDEYGIDYEAEIPDTYQSLHRIGKGFENGVDYVVLVTGNTETNATASFSSLASCGLSSVVEVTAGPAVVVSKAGLTHGIAAHLTSVDSVEEFRAEKAFQEILAASTQVVEGLFYPYQAPTVAIE